MKLKNILIIVISFIIITSLTLSTYAYGNNADSYYELPSDIGEIVETGGVIDDTIHKYYIVIQISDNIENDNNYYNITYTYKNNSTTINATYINTTFNVPYITYSNYDGFILMPSLNQYASILEGKTLYMPVYTRNITFIVNIISEHIDIYICESTKIESEIASESFNLGYNIGYTDGYNDGLPAGAGIHQDLNIVEHIQQLIGQFTGNEYAQYITPIALVLTILLIYFLFIRWLLSMIKAKGVLKVCDIIVLVACISILVVLYFPMINITTTQHQIIENVYSVTSDITP